MGLIDKAKKLMGKNKGNVWDMSTKEAREAQVKRDFELAKTHKNPHTQNMIKYDSYYNNKHYSQNKLKEIAQKRGWNYIPPCIPDPYIQVESQIDPEIPSFQFNPGEDFDPNKAKEREMAVEAVIYDNKVEDMNPSNERTMGITGNAFWKVAFKGEINNSGYRGKVTIGNPDTANMFPNTSAYDIDDAQFIVYAFRQHRMEARREHGEIIDGIPSDANHSDTEIYNRNRENISSSLTDDTMQCVEYWYRDEEGDIACSVQYNNVEVKHFPKYWKDTAASGNKMFPFVKYCKTPLSKSFWDKGEIEPIIDLVDTIDKLSDSAALNAQFSGNDIIITEDDTFTSPDYVIPTMPGSVITTKTNKGGTIRRLGGVANASNFLALIEWYSKKIQETNGNFDMNNGNAPPSNVTTLGGQAILNEQGNKRQNIKKADRKNGFRRLAELIDWTVLEFLNTDTNMMIKNPDDPNSSRVPFTFNRNNHMVLDSMATDQTGEPQYIFPKVDIEIQVGDSLKNDKISTLAATAQIAKTQITPANAELIKQQIEIIDLPNKDVISQSIDNAMQMMTQQPIGGPGGANPGIDPEQAKQIISSMTPEQQQVFFNASPQAQQIALQKMMQGGGLGG